MSYKTLAAAATDEALAERITACANQEAFNNPALSATLFGQQIQAGASPLQRLTWPVVVANEAAYASALAAGNPNPGGDEAVITDGAILAAVQVNWPADPEPPAP